MNTMPTIEEIKNLHRKYAPSEAAFDLIYTHSEVVWDIASQLIEQSNLDVDVDLVRAGCLLHDIGAYRLFKPDGEIDHPNYIKHGVLGDELLAGEGFGEDLRRIASHHTGVGLTREEIIEVGLPLPPDDYLAETTEERLVMYADKFHTKSTPPKFMTPEAYSVYVRKFGEHKVEKFKQLQAEFGTPDLMPIARKYGAEIV